MNRRLTYPLAFALAAAVVSGCASSPATSRASSPATAAASGSVCPTASVPVVVSVDQWGDIVRQLGGACAQVTIVVEGTSIDPHDYEPTTGDIAKFTDARLVVVNGADYDPWADKAVAALPSSPPVVDAAAVNGVQAGANPHLWYSPDYVEATAAAVTAALKEAAPAASRFFDTQASGWQDSMKPYFAQIAAIKSAATGAKYGATESVFDYMAQACGLVNATPQGYQNAAAAESDPAPGDVLAFNTALTVGAMQVLIYNTQTAGAIPEQINATATEAGVPIVDVTETVAPGSATFAAWQISQLHALATVLGVS